MKKIRKWKIIFAVFSLAYMGWVVHVGGNEFDRINSQYRAIVESLDQSRIKTAALKELITECRRESKIRSNRGEEACLTWPDQVLEAKGKEIEERLIRARERGIIKVVLFYTGFVLIFLLAPPVLIYLLIIGIIKLKKDITIVR